ncbi:MAG: methyltransferase domain-containing protein [Paracoccaceae bacterium]
MFAEDALSYDAFLGGKLHLFQPRRGYRAGVDPVLLAASVNATAGQSVLELGCGAGAAALCLAARVADLKLCGIERHADYAELARRNAAVSGANFSVIEADLTDLPMAVRQQQFDHVIANPPYFRRGRGTAARDDWREAALGEDTPLARWLEVGVRRLSPKGYIHIIQQAERMPDLLAACDDRLGNIEVLPFSPRSGRDAQLIVLRARAGGRAAFKLHAPVVMHKGNSHDHDGEDYSPLIQSVLRKGAGIEFSSIRC